VIATITNLKLKMRHTHDKSLNTFVLDLQSN